MVGVIVVTHGQFGKYLSRLDDSRPFAGTLTWPESSRMFRVPV